MSFWRREVIQPALDHETQKHVEEQRSWIAREPANPRPYYNLAQLYRLDQRTDEALGLLLEAVRLDESYADAHAALAEMYIVRKDDRAAWRHARAAELHGDSRAVELLQRYKVAE
jgi:cytochrome c-type biogenesis protein CcmH/NrfG